MEDEDSPRADAPVGKALEILVDARCRQQKNQREAEKKAKEDPTTLAVLSAFRTGSGFGT